MLRVAEHVVLNRCNESVRELLDAHEDPPLTPPGRAAHPAWSPLAPQRPDAAA